MSAKNTDSFKHYKSEIFKTTNKHCTITKIGKSDGIIYGSLIIPCNDKRIHEWKLKISSKMKSCTIGIAEPPVIFWGEGQVDYGYCNNGKRRGPNGIQENYNEPYKAGTITIVLDLTKKRKRLSFRKNNGLLKKAFNIAKTSVGYSLTVYIGNNNVNSTIQIVSYTCNQPSYSKRTKQSHTRRNDHDGSTDDLYFENDQLKQEIDDLYFENDQLNQKLEMFQMQVDGLMFEKSRLQRFSDEKNYELVDQCSRQKSMIQQMREQLADSIAENNVLKAVNCKLVEEYEARIDKLMQMNKENVVSYKEWDTSKILSWIMSLDDGRYLKYKEILSKSLAEEGIGGDDLDEVDGTDIKGWGIVNFKDKKYLKQKIEDLINLKDNNTIEGGYYQQSTEQL